jgi:biotin-(acetyl-CoA carboxylase) ligase
MPVPQVSGMLVNYNGRTGGVAGVGINVNQQFTATTALPAVSLAQVRQEIGQEHPETLIMVRVCTHGMVGHRKGRVS